MLLKSLKVLGLGLASALAIGFGGPTMAGGTVGADDGTFQSIKPGTRNFKPVPFPAKKRLTRSNVQRIIAQAVNEANARNANATIAIVDRVGNVLAVYQMNGADPDLALIAEVPREIRQGPLKGDVLRGAAGSGVDGFTIPNGAPLGAIAKAVTGAYLSSSGNAFTTRTANQIVQENFNPEETFQAGGPLFGVQFSQLTCSDLSTRFESDNGDGTVVGQRVGPNRSPLGLAADPGGMPIYKGGTMVGGIGVISDGVYGIDIRITDIDSELEFQDEAIALAGITGFEAPRSIRADRVTVEGNTLRYTDTEDDRDRLRANARNRPNFNQVLAQGQLVDVRGYYDVPTGTARDVLPGTAYGDAKSGYIPARELPGGSPFQNPNAFVLVDGNGDPRFSPRSGTDAPNGLRKNRLKRNEVISLIDEALGVALAGRAQIRRPLNSPIQVTVSIVDTNGAILGVARTPDGPIFGTDVSLQKARTAMFFSSDTAGQDLQAVPEIRSAPFLDSIGILSANNGFIPSSFTKPNAVNQSLRLFSGDFYVQNARDFIGPNALTGRTAFSDRGNGNLSRPFFPDGVQEGSESGKNPNGPFSRPFNSVDTTQNWSPFSTGLQFDLVGPNILQHLLFVLGVTFDNGLPVPDSPVGCASFALPNDLANPTDTVNTPLIPVRQPSRFALGPLANGAQIFAGSVPIYRGNTLIGGIGVSGDGIDQDDMISSLGLRRAGLRRGNGLGHPPERIRSDTIKPRGGNGSRLRYVSCPFKPFVNSNVQNACDDL